MTRRGWLLVCASVLGTSVAGYAGYTVTRRWRTPTPPARDPSAESELFRLINAERSRYNFKVKGAKSGEEERPLPALQQDQSLQQVAIEHAENMASTQMVEAQSEEAIAQELLSSGYVFESWARVPASLKQTTLSDALADWMKDPQHRATKMALLNPFLKDIGIGVLRDNVADHYYVYMLLGKKK